MKKVRVSLWRHAFVFTLIFVLFSSMGFAQAQTEKYSVTVALTNYPVGECGGFQIWVDQVTLFTWVDRFDTNGEFVQRIRNVRVIGQSLYYNSTNPQKFVAGGPGEVENSYWNIATGELSLSGLELKVKVRGYGIIVAETGNTIFQCDPNTFQNCQLVSNTGHNQFFDQDLAALCAYLQ